MTDQIWQYSAPFARKNIASFGQQQTLLQPWQQQCLPQVVGCPIWKSRFWTTELRLGAMADYPVYHLQLVFHFRLSTRLKGYVNVQQVLPYFNGRYLAPFTDWYPFGDHQVDFPVSFLDSLSVEELIAFVQKAKPVAVQFVDFIRSTKAHLGFRFF